LSGWPSETDSDVKRKSFDTLKLQQVAQSTRVAGLFGWRSGERFSRIL